MTDSREKFEVWYQQGHLYCCGHDWALAGYQLRDAEIEKLQAQIAKFEATSQTFEEISASYAKTLAQGAMMRDTLTGFKPLKKYLHLDTASYTNAIDVYNAALSETSDSEKFLNEVRAKALEDCADEIRRMAKELRQTPLT